MTMPTNEERRKQHRIDLDAVMEALIDQRRKVVAKAMVSISNNKVPSTLAAKLSEIQNGINAVALAARQEEMRSIMCKHWDYLLVSPTKFMEEIEK